MMYNYREREFVCPKCGVRTQTLDYYYATWMYVEFTLYDRSDGKMESEYETEDEAGEVLGKSPYYCCPKCGTKIAESETEVRQLSRSKQPVNPKEMSKGAV